MNINEYRLGDTNNEVFLTVKVSTPAISVTKIEVTSVAGDSEEKAVSEDGTGNISRTSLGFSEDLKGSLLEISTESILDHIPEEDKPVCLRNLTVRYELEYGESNQAFLAEQRDKSISDSGNTICVEKYLQLT